MTEPSRRFQAVRDLAIGLGSAAIILWLFVFGTVAAVEVFTLAAVVGTLIWISTTDVRILRDPGSGHASPMIFGLATVAMALLVTALVFIGSLISYLAAALGITAVVVGLVRVYRRPPPTT